MTDVQGACVEQVAICRKPIFVIGSPRSGTTILAWSLAEHTQLWASEETVILEHLYGRGRADTSFRLTTSPPIKNWFKAQDVGRDELMRYLGVGINALLTSRSGGRRWIDQTPSYTFIAGLLADMFPDALFLHILRDGRRVVNSMIHFLNALDEESRAERMARGFVPPWAREIRAASTTWQQYVRGAMEFAGEHPERCLTVRYEELVAQPEDGFREIFRFLAVSPENAPIDYFRSTRLNSSFRQGSGSPPSDPWSDWTPEQKRIFLEEAGDTMAAYGLLSRTALRQLRDEIGGPASHAGAPILRLSPADTDAAVESAVQAGSPIEVAQVPLCRNPVFVIGAQRSGTSILARSLGLHSLLWFSIEGMILYRLYGPDRLERVYAYGSMHHWRWLAREHVSQAEFLQKLGLGMNALYTSRSKGKRWIEKTPENSLIADELAQMFPGSLFLHILRDGRQVVNSMIHRVQAPRWGRDFRLACHDWRTFAQAAARFGEEHPERCLTVRYEELVARPEDGFREIFRFVGVPFDEKPVTFFRSTRLNSSFEQSPVPPSPDPWSDWTPEQKRIFLEEAGDAMAQFGMVTPAELQLLQDEAAEEVPRPHVG